MDPSNPADPYIRPLNRENTRAIDRTGGTVLHTSRTNPRKMAESKLPKSVHPDRVKKLPFDGKHYDFTSIVLENLDRLGVGCLITIGGDEHSASPPLFLPPVCPSLPFPKPWTTTFRAPNTASAFPPPSLARKNLSPASAPLSLSRTHRRLPYLRTRRRFTALYTAYVTSTRCLIPEYPFDFERVAKLLSDDKRNNPATTLS